MLARVVPFLRGFVTTRPPCNYTPGLSCNLTPRLPCYYAQFYHKEISNVQVRSHRGFCTLFPILKSYGNPKFKLIGIGQIVGQKRAYFLAVRQPEKGGERFLKLTERSGGRHTYISINLRFAGPCLSIV